MNGTRSKTSGKRTIAQMKAIAEPIVDAKRAVSASECMTEGDVLREMIDTRCCDHVLDSKRAIRVLYVPAGSLRPKCKSVQDSIVGYSSISGAIGAILHAGGDGELN